MLLELLGKLQRGGDGWRIRSRTLCSIKIQQNFFMVSIVVVLFVAMEGLSFDDVQLQRFAHNHWKGRGSRAAIFGSTCKWNGGLVTSLPRPKISQPEDVVVQGRRYEAWSALQLPCLLVWVCVCR